MGRGNLILFKESIYMLNIFVIILYLEQLITLFVTKQDVEYLTPYVEEVKRERAERTKWDAE